MSLASCQIDPLSFRKVLGLFPTGVVVISGGAEQPIGMTVSSFASVSLDPPLVLWCFCKESEKGDKLLSGKAHAINFLCENQKDISHAFACKGSTGEGLTEGKPPILEGALAHLECVLESRLDGGDHWIVLSRVVDMKVREETSPLVFCGGQYRALSVA